MKNVAPTITQLETAEEFDALAPGDVVDTAPVQESRKGPMLVSKESRGKMKMLLQRLNHADIMRAMLEQKDIQVEDGVLKFDLKGRAEKISVLSDLDCFFYEGYREELEAAGLE